MKNSEVYFAGSTMVSDQTRTAVWALKVSSANFAIHDCAINLQEHDQSCDYNQGFIGQVNAQRDCNDRSNA